MPQNLTRKIDLKKTRIRKLISENRLSLHNKPSATFAEFNTIFPPERITWNQKTADGK